MPITLPTQPTGEQFEDFVAATLRALGYFIETRVVLREEKKEVLEIDVVATPLGESMVHRELVEAKKDGISFPNLFKLYGQRQYLGIQSACLASLKDADPLDRPIYNSKGAELNVRVCSHPIDFDHLDSLAPARNGLATNPRKIVAAVAWYVQIAKRLAQAALVEECNRNKGDDLYERARRYAFQVNASFFEKTALERAEALYSAYFNSPKLTGELVGRLAAAHDVSERIVLFLDSEDELDVLEALTRIPRGEIIQSLRLMDEFFAPDGKSMFYTIKGRLLCLKLVPGFVHGIGSFLRLDLFDLKDYDAKYSDLGWLLAKWHNAAYAVLEPELKAKH